MSWEQRAESAGKSGMPTTAAPVRIFRPGDAGFPESAGHYNEPERIETMSDTKPCRFEGCTKPKVAGKGQVYCTHHAEKSNRQPGGAAPVRKASSKKPAAPVVAAAIASLRTKQGKPSVRVSDSAFDTQVGGDHYRQMAIQPVEFITKNKLGFCAGNVIKYVCRHHAKGGPEDLDKAIHYLQLEREQLYGKATA